MTSSEEGAFSANAPGCDELNKSKDLTDHLKKRIIDAVDAFNDAENRKLKEEIASGNY